MTTLAIIPAAGGPAASLRLPCGPPLVAWSIEDDREVTAVDGEAD